MNKGTLIVLDGNSLAHRAFYAIPLLSTQEGVFTNAAYGFMNMLWKIIGEFQPEYLAVAFDKGKLTFRNDQYTEYKAHRKSTPEELRPQFGVIKRLLEAMRIPTLELEGFEADDLIGTVVRRAEAEGLSPVVVTGDRDALQLVSDKTRAIITKKGISEFETYDREAVFHRYQLRPEQIIDLKGLMGDQSDNIPGVPGVGEKTALKLVQEFGSLENLLANLDAVPGKLREKLETHSAQAELSKKLATIDTNCPVEVDFEACRLTPPNLDQLIPLLKKYELRSLLKSVLETYGENRAEAEQQFFQAGSYRVVTAESDLEELEAELRRAEMVAVDFGKTAGHPLDAAVDALYFSTEPGKAWEVSLTGTDTAIRKKYLLPVLSDPGIRKYFFDVKLAYHCANRLGVKLAGVAGDVMLAAYLVNPGLPNQKPEDLSLAYLNRVFAPPSDPGLAGCLRADLISHLVQPLESKLEEAGLTYLYRDVELELARVLAGMEEEGITVDLEQLKVMSRELGQQLEELTGKIYELAGEEFNLNSPKQLAVILFDKLKLPVLKKTKTGPSTSAAVLEELAPYHEIVARMLEHRQLMKLKSTYVDSLQTLIHPLTGRLHTSFNQTVTATGRLSSTEPNLQNIPVRFELGRKIRKVFGPSAPDRLIMTADYSQIELRILAHISGDPALIAAFHAGEDIHTRTAAEVFGVPLEKVTREMRTKAKAINFGIVYGISDFGLSRDIGVTRAEAKRYIDSYFERYRGVKKYLDEVVAEARERGYVTTVLNRRRYLPDLTSSNKMVRSFGERTAMNTPIQGSAADIIKLAMVKVDEAIRRRGLLSRMILQVHDELIFDVPKSELTEMAEIVRQGMEKALTLSVPLEVEIKVGPNWYDLALLQAFRDLNRR